MASRIWVKRGCTLFYADIRTVSSCNHNIIPFWCIDILCVYIYIYIILYDHTYTNVHNLATDSQIEMSIPHSDSIPMALQTGCCGRCLRIRHIIGLGSAPIDIILETAPPEMHGCRPIKGSNHQILVLKSNSD